MISIDLKSFASKLNAIAAKLPKAIEASQQALAEELQKEVINNAHRMFKHNGANGIAANVKIIQNGSFSKTVIVDKDYSYWVEEGNNQKGPYIYPKNKKALRFVINGNVIFAKKVRTHGGTHFFAQAVKTVEKKSLSIITKAIWKSL